MGQHKIFRSFRSRKVKEVANRESIYGLRHCFNGNAGDTSGTLTADEVTKDWLYLTVFHPLLINTWREWQLLHGELMNLHHQKKLLLFQTMGI